MKDFEIPQGTSDRINAFDSMNELFSSALVKKEHASTEKTSNKKAPAWASKWGFYVHQVANSVTINALRAKGVFDEDVARFIIIQLNKGTVYADSEKFQTGEYAYRHAMRNSGQTVEEAKQLADQFVRERYAWALSSFENEDYAEAFFTLGVALHALQDATSPVHGGFQEWSGDESIVEMTEHAIKEKDYPGTDSNLQKITNKFIISFLMKKELASGNLFDNIKTD